MLTHALQQETEKIQHQENPSMALLDYIRQKQSIVGRYRSSEVLDDEVTSIFENDNYQMLFINSSYEVASPELTSQLEVVNNLVHKYDKNAIIAGEGPLTNDLIKISDEDFKNVSIVILID